MNAYVDNAATTAVSQTALDALLPCFRELHGTPSRLRPKGDRRRATPPRHHTLPQAQRLLRRVKGQHRYDPHTGQLLCQFLTQDSEGHRFNSSKTGKIRKTGDVGAFPWTNLNQGLNVIHRPRFVILTRGKHGDYTTLRYAVGIDAGGEHASEGFPCDKVLVEEVAECLGQGNHAVFGGGFQE